MNTKPVPVKRGPLRPSEGQGRTKPRQGGGLSKIGQTRYGVGVQTIDHPVRGNTVLLRREIGEVLRRLRLSQQRTLRDVSAQAQVSLGYLSEVERGQKEASSELLCAICSALGVPLAVLLREVSDRVAAAEGWVIPDTVPDELVFQQRIMAP